MKIRLYALLLHAGDDLPHSPVQLHALTELSRPSPAVLFIPGVRVLVRAAVNHLCAVFPLFKLAFISLLGCYCAAAELS